MSDEAQEREHLMIARAGLMTVVGLMRYRKESGRDLDQLELALDHLNKIVDGDNYKERYAALDRGEPDPGRSPPPQPDVEPGQGERWTLRRFNSMMGDQSRWEVEYEFAAGVFERIEVVPASKLSEIEKERVEALQVAGREMERAEQAEATLANQAKQIERAIAEFEKRADKQDEIGTEEQNSMLAHGNFGAASTYRECARRLRSLSQQAGDREHG